MQKYLYLFVPVGEWFAGLNPWKLALIIFVLSLVRLSPQIYVTSEHTDEYVFSYRAGYYRERLSRLDFSPAGEDSFVDPGFSPDSYFSVTQPFGSNLVFATAASIGNLTTPSLPYSYTDPSLQGPETRPVPRTLHGLRWAGVLCASLGLALITYHFRWPGAAAVLVFLGLPFVAADLSRATGDGPVLFGLGLCALSYRSRWFPVACGAAAAFKLTALGVWPLMLLRGASGKARKFDLSLALLTASLAWSALNPASWFLFGPFYLFVQIYHRIGAYIGQSGSTPGTLGVFLPTRYLWPFELGVLLVLAYSVSRFNLLQKSKAFLQSRP